MKTDNHSIWLTEPDVILKEKVLQIVNSKLGTIYGFQNYESYKNFTNIVKNKLKNKK